MVMFFTRKKNHFSTTWRRVCLHFTETGHNRFGLLDVMKSEVIKKTLIYLLVRLDTLQMSIMSPLKRKERDWEMNNEYGFDASDSREEEEQEEPQIRKILVQLSKKFPSQRPVISYTAWQRLKTICFGLLKEKWFTTTAEFR